MQNKNPTIKEIAIRLNVSVSTVSRAMHDNPRIGLGTRLKVQALAKELGYEPNTQAIFFKQKQTRIIGVVLPDIREDFFSLAISGIETAAVLNNYTILFGQSYNDIEIEKNVVGAMRKQRVDGLIISLSKDTNKYEHLLAFEKFDIPVVYFDRVPKLDNINKVYCDMEKGTVEMVSELFARGFRRIALLNGPKKLAASQERLNGYINGISKQKLKVNMQLVETTDFSKASTQEAMKKFLALKQPPQAIITFNDYVHMDAVQYANEMKININKDLVFASYANLPITQYTSHPPILSLEQFPHVQGEKAMEMMMKIIYEKAENKLTENSFHCVEITGSLKTH